MKNKYCIYMILIVVLSFNAFSKPLEIGSNDYAPYTFFEGSKATGFCSDLAYAIFKKINVDMEIVKLSWARVADFSKDAKIFGAIPYFKTSAREKDYFFTAPIIRTINKFYYSKEKYPKGINWNNLKDLKPYTLGSVKGFWYVEDFDKNGLTHESVNEDLQNIKKLYYKKIDLIILDEVMGKMTIEKEFPTAKGAFESTQKEYSSANMYIMISKKSPNAQKIIKQFNAALKELVENGEYSKLLKKYKLPDYFKPKEL